MSVSFHCILPFCQWRSPSVTLCPSVTVSDTGAGCPQSTLDPFGCLSQVLVANPLLQYRDASLPWMDRWHLCHKAKCYLSQDIDGSKGTGEHTELPEALHKTCVQVMLYTTGKWWNGKVTQASSWWPHHQASPAEVAATAKKRILLFALYCIWIHVLPLKQLLKRNQKHLRAPFLDVMKGFYQMQGDSAQKALSLPFPPSPSEISRGTSTKTLFHMSWLSRVLYFLLHLDTAHFQKYIIQYLTSVICLKP